MRQALAAGLLSFVACAHAFAADSHDAQVVDELRARWDRNRSAIQTAVIEYRSVHRPAQPQRKYDDVSALLAKTPLVNNDEAIKNFIVSLDTTLKGQKELWSFKVFQTDGTDRRIDSTNGGTTSTHMLVGDNEVLANPRNRQIDLCLREKSRRHLSSIGEFNCIPSPSFLQDATVTHSKRVLPLANVTLSSRGEEVVVEKESGFVIEHRRGSPHSRCCIETIQYRPTKHEGDVLLPSVVFTGRYRMGMLEVFTLTIIDGATINEPVYPDAFVVSAAKGDVVVDRRDGELSTTELTEGIYDVLSYQVR